MALTPSSDGTWPSKKFDPMPPTVHPATRKPRFGHDFLGGKDPFCETFAGPPVFDCDGTCGCATGDFTTVYEGRLPSASANDIVVTTTFTENAEGAEPVSSQARLTSVKVLIRIGFYFAIVNVKRRIIR